MDLFGIKTLHNYKLSRGIQWILEFFKYVQLQYIDDFCKKKEFYFLL